MEVSQKLLEDLILNALTWFSKALENNVPIVLDCLCVWHELYALPGLVSEWGVP